ncbi:polymorphic toxin type 15 domain-containing protein [Amycolatopsis sp. CA-128772]|uniref:polymorphic toxin type 15 domain-containing protein n=1 Tax=Amycolatopsis sp. CA-128772 TaxID=2073159 RepID=UPI000CD2EB37|nr:polymorphic toxin type 15 domain-containing protein [Amycolatopsis sp. CA-128772]
MLAFQRTVGNRPVARLLSDTPVVQRSTLKVTRQNAARAADPGRLDVPITKRFSSRCTPPVKDIEFTVRVPPHFRKDPALENRFREETRRQLKIQLLRLNGQRLDRWFVKLDLFGAPKEESRLLDWTRQRTPAHLNKVHRELYRRAHEERERVSLQHRAEDRRARLGEASKRLTQVSSPRELVALLSSLEEDWARDLVGRSNSQSRWKEDHRAEIERLFARHARAGGAWEGLARSWRSLAPLHNPDQVAGGDRHLPRHPDRIAGYVGPGVVNSALGAGWGLPKETVVDERTELPVVTVPSRMVQLREQMLREYPPASWALLTTRFRVVVTWAE